MSNREVMYPELRVKPIQTRPHKEHLATANLDRAKFKHMRMVGTPASFRSELSLLRSIDGHACVSAFYRRDCELLLMRLRLKATITFLYTICSHLISPSLRAKAN